MEESVSHADVTLEPVAEHDFAALRDLAGAIWRSHYAGIISVAQIEYMLADRFADAALEAQTRATGAWLELLRVAGQPVGYCASACAGRFGDEGTAALKLGQLYVHQSHRGLGLGRRMLDHVECRGRQLGRPLLFLQVNKRNTSAIGFYEAAGFTIAHEAVFDIGSGFVMDDYVMEKRVAAEAPVAAADGLTSRSGRRGDRRG
jgi:ribosomal protein S18 acetylase RimI-like enzyme